LHIVPTTTSSWWPREIGGSASASLPIISLGIVFHLCLRMECLRIGQVVISTFDAITHPFDPVSKVSLHLFLSCASLCHVVPKCQTLSPPFLSNSFFTSDNSITKRASLSWALPNVSSCRTWFPRRPKTNKIDVNGVSRLIWINC
jgi:hypothetical protein